MAGAVIAAMQLFGYKSTSGKIVKLEEKVERLEALLTESRRLLAKSNRLLVRSRREANE